jgi:vacuolar-type H+-ATPase subunit E/Vma4
MSLDALKKEILAQAKKQVSTIESDVREQMTAIDQQTEQRIAELTADHERLLKDDLERLERTLRAQATSAATQVVLNTKNKLVEDVFVNAMSALKDQNDKILPKLLKKAQSEIAIHIVRCAKSDEKHFSKFKVEIADIDGGFIAENKDGTITLDYTYSNLLSSLRHSKLREVVEVLFSAS